MQNTPLNAAKRGFTLIEVMMATFVLVLIFLSTLAAIQQGFSMLDTARNTTLAGQVIQSEIEDLRLRPWISMPASGTIDLAASIGEGLSQTERTMLANRFTATRTIVGMPGSPYSRKLRAVLRYRRGGKVLAVATVGRDLQSLEAEAAMERDATAAPGAISR